MKYPYILSFCLYLLLNLVACTDKFGDLQYTHLSFVVDTSKLQLPSNVAIRFTEAELSMEDQNRWNEMLTYSIQDVEAGISFKIGYYNKIRFTAQLHYTENGETVSFPVSCNLNNISTAQNMIKPEVQGKLPLERSKL